MKRNDSVFSAPSVAGISMTGNMNKIFTKGITLRYALALGILAALSVTAFFTLYKIISSQKSNAAIINTSGSLRWLSQRAAIYAQDLVQSHKNSDRETIRQELLRVANRIETSFQRLTSGDSRVGIAKHLSPQIKALYFDQPMLLEKQLREYIAEIKALVDCPDNKLIRSNPHLRHVLTASKTTLLDSLDVLVKQYQWESERESNRLQGFEIGVMSLTLFTLMMEMVFIFRPMVRRIRQDAARTIQEGEDRFRMLVESSLDGIFAYDKDIHCTIWNKAMEQISGVPRENLLGRNALSVFPFLEGIGEGDSLRNATKDKATISYGIRYNFHQTDKSGYFDSAHFPLLDTNGAVVGGMGIIREVTGRILNERRWSAQHAVTRVLAESASIGEASQKILQTICDALEWDVGGLWLVNTGTGALYCVDIYHPPHREVQAFKVASKQASFQSGVGLPGHVLATGQPHWIADVTCDPNFPRASIALKEGLRGAFGFPIINNNEIIGVMEFFSHSIRQPDEELLNMMGVTGIQIGQFIRRKQAEAQLVKLSHAVEQSSCSVIITDTKGHIEYVNPKVAQITGYAKEELIGKSPHIFKSNKTPHQQYKHLWDTIKSGGEWRGEFLNKKKSGELYWEYASISPVKNTEGVITHFIAVKEDITERKQFADRLEFLADHDPLTNLFNRRRFQKELDWILSQARRYSSYGALLIFDLDHFKYVNDTLGYQVGDEVLVNVSKLLKERLRETDTIARLGGDEFAIILPNINADQAQATAKQILEIVQGYTLVINGHSAGVTASIGIAIFPDHGDAREGLLACADLAMYQAKESGRNRTCIYSSNYKEKLASRVTWEKRIRTALKQDHFFLHVQPILDLQSNQIASYEALLRMKCEDGSIIYPADFLGIAERFNLIREIDQWVICHAIHFISEHQLDKKGISLEVNLSGTSFNDAELLKTIRESLIKTRINPHRLIIEITETAAIGNITEAKEFIETLQLLGCRFALDDFGIGFSSFSYLKNLSFDFIKIDGSFIRDIPRSFMDQHLVKAMVEIARGLGKKTIAEYVGNEETVQLLREYGVDYAQGYHIGKPGLWNTFF
ncbi:MAG: hypothetical protein HW390_2958 [Candidatus Brocadiaceae bacterium]|nr:hypothetical protein [Candidatus Brocadiaceae bacterium]